MNLDGLASAIWAISNDPAAKKLSELLLHWKANDSNVEELVSAVERYIGNSWIASDQEFKDIYRLWSQFCEDAVLGIRGMSMNERLYWFGLVTRFDQASTDSSRTAIYTKLLARP